MADTKTTTTYLDATNGNAEVELDPSDAKTKWLLSEGYLTIVKPKKADEDRGRDMTSVPAQFDPTLAVNREKPTPVNDIPPHVANGDDEGDEGETTHGANMGLDADPVGNTDQAPDVKITTHKDAGTEGAVEGGSDASLKEDIAKQEQDTTTGRA